MIIVVQRCVNIEQNISVIAHVLLHISQLPRLIQINLFPVTIYRSLTVENTLAEWIELIIIVNKQSDNIKQDNTIFAHVLLHISQLPRLIQINLFSVTIYRLSTVENTLANWIKLIIIVNKQSDNIEQDNTIFAHDLLHITR